MTRAAINDPASATLPVGGRRAARVGPTRLPVVESSLSTRRLALLGVASLIGPAALMLEVSVARGADVPLGIAPLIVTALVLVRLNGVTAALRQSELRFRSLVQNASDVTAILAVDGTTLYESPAVSRVLGYRPDELTERNGLDLVHPEDATYMSQL
ncbi:MAG TPA: PAS domain S-box protein, partial [Candidatus Limnocylindria bacterium]|nr:PAS domain S-box protein [Candidatus Limnocylindria bacterium]